MEYLKFRGNFHVTTELMPGWAVIRGCEYGPRDTGVTAGASDLHISLVLQVVIRTKTCFGSLFEERLHVFWHCQCGSAVWTVPAWLGSRIGVGVQLRPGLIVTPSASGAGVQWHVVLWLDITWSLFILGYRTPWTMPSALDQRLAQKHLSANKKLGALCSTTVFVLFLSRLPYWNSHFSISWTGGSAVTVTA